METRFVTHERRSATRRRVRLQVQTEKGTGVTRDFSLSGLYLVTDSTLSVGESISLRVALPDPDHSRTLWVACRGNVVRVERIEDGVGAAVALESGSLAPLQMTA